MIRVVPLFPLPNVVLFPGAVLPLHIFEHRYRAMMEYCLSDTRQFAMALLRPGWEKTYHGRPDIEPVVCLGTILSHERLPDGRYNLLLQGTSRARVLQELPEPHPFRLAKLELFSSTGQTLEIDLSDQREQLRDLLETGFHRDLNWSKMLRRMINEPISTVQLADLMAFGLIDDVKLKQSLLADPDPIHRLRTLIQALRQQAPLSAAMESPIAHWLN